MDDGSDGFWLDAKSEDRDVESMSARACRVWIAFAREPGPDSRRKDEDAEVDAVVEEFGGDPWAAIRALLHDLDVLAADFASSVSRGYVRGGAPNISRLHASGGERAASGE